MALSCPNKSLPEWKRLVDEVGEREALNDYFQFGTIRSPYAVKDKLERLNIANYTNKNFKIGERYFKPTVESLIDVEKNSSVVDAMVTHFGYRGLQSEEDLIKRKFTQLYQYHKDIEPEQIHILGSKQDIEGFKKFVTTRNIINTYGINITNEDDIRPVETNINNEEKSLKLALKGLTPEEKISFCNHFGITMTEENGTKC